MKYELFYHKSVVEEDIPLLDVGLQERIKNAIETKLLTRPEFFGKPLRKSLKGFRKLRVGDYRVVFLLHGQKIEIFAIQHRSRVYKK